MNKWNVQERLECVELRLNRIERTRRVKSSNVSQDVSIKFARIKAKWGLYSK